MSVRDLCIAATAKQSPLWRGGSGTGTRLYINALCVTAKGKVINLQGFVGFISPAKINFINPCEYIFF